MMKLYAPFIGEATLRVTMTLRSEGHGGDPSPKLQGANEELELELIQTQMAQKPVLRAEVGMHVRCANNASAESQEGEGNDNHNSSSRKSHERILTKLTKPCLKNDL